MRTDSGIDRSSRLALNGGNPVREHWLPYGHQTISEADIAAVCDALRSDWLTQGPRILEFESTVASACNVKHAIALNSGTAALHAAYFAAGVGAGDQVITTGMSFAATSNAAIYLGATPRFADVSIDTGLIEPESVAGLVTSKNVKAIVAVDYAGQPCDVDALVALAKKHGIYLIIDAAHSLGATYNGTPVGSHADMTTLSFHPVKSITTGEGGMVLTNSDALADKLRMFRTHGITKDVRHFEEENEGPWYHEMQCLGFNYRITDVQAALGTSQMGKLDSFIARRAAIAARYRDLLSNKSYLRCLEQKMNRTSANHLFPILLNEPFIKKRKKFVEALHAENIGVQVHYIPTYKHPYYRRPFGDGAPSCPVTDEFYSREISLPIFPGMSDEDIEDVTAALDKVSRYLVS